MSSIIEWHVYTLASSDFSKRASDRPVLDRIGLVCASLVVRHPAHANSVHRLGLRGSRSVGVGCAGVDGVDVIIAAACEFPGGAAIGARRVAARVDIT